MLQKMTYAEWAEKLKQAPDELEYSRWMGMSPGGAAVQLKVSRQRVWQLVKDSKLDMLMLADNPKAKPSAWLITDASLSRYAKSKPGVQQDLLSASTRRRKAAS